MKNFKDLSILIGIFLLVGCAAPMAKKAYETYNLGKGGTAAVQAMKPIGYEEEKAIGGSLAIQVFNRFGGRHRDQELQRYVTLVGQSLVDVSDRPDIDYYFAVVNSNDPNAFATPGGYVFLSVGLLRLLENEAQLAGVLGHEITHISHKHALQTIERNKKLAGIGSLTIGLMGQDPGLFDKVIEQAADVLFKLGLDKGLEYEADEVGTDYASRIGYNPSGLKDFLNILKSKVGEDSVFFSTHPSPSDRYNKLISKFGDMGSGPLLAQEYKSSVSGHL